jgi:hypothetical protein
MGFVLVVDCASSALFTKRGSQASMCACETIPQFLTALPVFPRLRITWVAYRNTYGTAALLRLCFQAMANFPQLQKSDHWPGHVCAEATAISKCLVPKVRTYLGMAADKLAERRCFPL